MGVPLWRSILFFVLIAAFGIMLFPSQRETGKLYAQAGFFDKARFYLEKQFHQDPTDIANAKRYLESLLYHRENAVFTRTIKKLLKLNPDSITLLEIAANFYADNMDYEQASIYWMKIVREAPPSPKVDDVKEKLIAYCMLEKKYDTLISIYNLEIDKERGNLDTYYELARLYALERKLPETISTYNALLVKYPDESPVKERLAELYEFSDEIDKAITLYREVAKSEPGNKNYALRLIEVLLKYKKNEEALNALEIFSKRFPGEKQFVELLAEIYIRSGRREEAITLMENLYLKDPENYVLLRTLGQLYYDANQHTKAFETLRRYNEKTGGDATSHHLLGDLFADMGDTSGSRREYEKALELIQQEDR